MKFNPRYYQVEAITKIFDYWSTTAGHPLVDMAGGTGKSGTMGMLIKRLVEEYDGMRVLSCVHVEELVGDNFKEFLGLAPFADAGIYAASLGRRDTRNQVIFAQLQTVWNKAAAIGHIDVMVIDEVHLVPEDGNTMYRQLISALLAINPDMKLVGFTATPYRTTSGRLDEGDDHLFDKIVYTYSLAQGIEDGYLSRLTSRPASFTYDMTGVRRHMGDFKRGELAAATDKEELTRAAVEEVLRYAAEEDRKCALFFCNGIEHATHVRDEVRKQGRTCEVLSGKTPKGERRRIIADLKSGKLWGCTNDNVLSTGTNIPPVDLIADLAPTESTSRYVQRAVRGTRVVWPRGFNPDAATAEERKAAIARGPKPNCRYLNFAGNVERHGPVDCVTPRTPGKGTGDPPSKLCPTDVADIKGRFGCDEILHASARECPNCGYVFTFSEKPKFFAQATDVAILATVADPEPRTVTKRVFRHHPGRDGKRDSVKITYFCGMATQINEWVCPEHEGFPRNKAQRYWKEHKGQLPYPKTVLEWLQRQAELCPTAEIMVRPSGKFWSVDSHKPAEFWVAAVEPKKKMAAVMGDCVPF